MKRNKVWLGLAISVLMVLLILFVPGASARSNSGSADRSVAQSPAAGNQSSPTVADIDGDGKDEILWGSGNTVYCFDCNGNQRWARDTGGRVSASPAAWDVNGDGLMEVFVGNEAAWLWGFDASGNNLPGWPIALPPARPCSEAGCFSSPAIGDINGDGSMEIVTGCWGMRVWAFHWWGAVVPGFPVDVKDTIWSSPAIGDVNGDGLNEIVIGADCTAGQGWPYPSGGLLFVLNGAGQNVPGFPKWTPQVLWSSPALGDLNGDKIADIVIGTGFYYQGVGGTCYYAWDGWGNNIPSWPVDIGAYTMDSPALGDVNGDGMLEVATLAGVFDCHGRKLPGYDLGMLYNSALSDATLGDINGDGKIDRVLGEANAAAVGDFNRDGLVEMVGTPPAINHTNARYKAALCPWPMFHHDSRHSGLVPPPPRPNYETYVLLQNPGNKTTSATLEYMMDAGQRSSQKVSLEPHSRHTVPVNDAVGYGKNVSTKVSCDVPITAERAVYFNASGRTDGSDSIGTPEPSREWYLAEGYTGGSFDTWIPIQNPGDKEADVIVSLMKGDGTVVPVGIHMKACSRETLHVDEVLGCEACDVSAKVTATRPVVVERSMYFDYNGINGGHNSIGVTAPRKAWYMAEGCTGWGFDTYVLVMNPGDAPSRVNYTFMTDDGRNVLHTETLEPHSRKTVQVNKIPGLESCNFSVQTSSDKPVCAERAMYFNNDGRNGGHETVAAAEPSTTWYLPEGYTGESFDTWITIQNPGGKPAAVEATYMKPGGGTVVQKYMLAPRARFTVHVDTVPGLESTEVSTELISTNGVGFVAERSMYFLYKGIWDGGHNTIGITQPSKTWYFAEGCTG